MISLPIQGNTSVPLWTTWSLSARALSKVYYLPILVPRHILLNSDWGVSIDVICRELWVGSNVALGGISKQFWETRRLSRPFDRWYSHKEWYLQWRRCTERVHQVVHFKDMDVAVDTRAWRRSPKYSDIFLGQQISGQISDNQFRGIDSRDIVNNKNGRQQKSQDDA